MQLYGLPERRSQVSYIATLKLHWVPNSGLTLSDERSALCSLAGLHAPRVAGSRPWKVVNGRRTEAEFMSRAAVYMCVFLAVKIETNARLINTYSDGRRGTTVGLVRDKPATRFRYRKLG